MTPIQKKAAQAIVNVYETDSVRGRYGMVTLIKGDRGGLTYGRSQTTRASGNLYTLVQQYCDAPGAKYAAALRPYLPRLKRKDATLDYDTGIKLALRQAGEDPVMRSVQDTFFDGTYWAEALRQADKLGIRTALGIAVVYDSTVHGSLARIAQRTTKAVGTVAAAGEQAWITMYLKLRKTWLLSCKMPLPNTVYRQDGFRALIAAGKWNLALPFTVRGHEISLQTLEIAAPEEEPWTLFVNGKRIGATWQNEADDFRNYIPARAFYEALSADSAARLKWQSGALYWDGQRLAVPALIRGEGDEAAAWAQVRGLAGATGLAIERDPATRTLKMLGNLATPQTGAREVRHAN
jgi:chitosanase